MTQEEAIINLEKLIALYYTASEQNKMVDYSKIIETLEFSAVSLRTPTREQVEKMWSGCEYCTGDVNYRPYLDLHSKRYYIDEFGILTDENEDNSISELNFCPVCGRPLTDEAVEMILERMEKIK